MKTLASAAATRRVETCCALQRLPRRQLSLLLMLTLPAALQCARAATFTVTTSDDATQGAFGDSANITNLRAAIIAANASSDPSNTILFAPALSGPITLTAPLPLILNNLTIDGAAQIAIDGANTYRIFFVGIDDATRATAIAPNFGASPLVNRIGVHLAGLTLQNAVAKGGSGGGGGMGAGGALFVNGAADVVLNNVSFSANQAVGGSGFGGGGGGGMGGNGHTPYGGGGGLLTGGGAYAAGGGIFGNGGADAYAGGGGYTGNGGNGNHGSGAGNGQTGTRGLFGITANGGGSAGFGGEMGGGGGGGNGGSTVGTGAGGGGGFGGGTGGVPSHIGGAGGFGGGGGSGSAGLQGGDGGFGGGGATYASGGFGGGGGNASNGDPSTHAGHGGFGGGGGNGNGHYGGNGGFGGGGAYGSPAGTGGFGAGNADPGGAGGGGAGLGGAVFVADGGALTIYGAGSETGSSSSGGFSFTGTSQGQGFGSAMFLQGASGSITVNPLGQIMAFSGAIDDEAGAAAAGAKNPGTPGQGGLSVVNGTLMLEGDSLYSGGTTIEATGTVLASTNGHALGSGDVNNDGTLSFVTPLTESIGGTYTQSAGAALEVGIDATCANDRLNVGAAANLDGTLTIALAPACVPALGQSFTLLHAAQINGHFANATATKCAAITLNSAAFTLEYTSSVKLIRTTPSDCLFSDGFDN